MKVTPETAKAASEIADAIRQTGVALTAAFKQNPELANGRLGRVLAAK